MTRSLVSTHTHTCQVVIMKVKLLTVAIVRIVEIVGGYSISLKELRDILSYLYTGGQSGWVRSAVLNGTTHLCIH